jgi:hypothetical protein
MLFKCAITLSNLIAQKHLEIISSQILEILGSLFICSVYTY